jgi:hypothetical protein
MYNFLYIRHRGPPKKSRNEGCRGWLQDGGCKSEDCRMKVAGMMVVEVKVAAMVVEGAAVVAGCGGGIYSH